MQWELTVVLYGDGQERNVCLCGILYRNISGFACKANNRWLLKKKWDNDGMCHSKSIRNL